MSTVLAFGIVAFLAWNAVGAASRSVQSSIPKSWNHVARALRWSEERRLERWLEDSQSIYELPPGYGSDLLHAVREHVPLDGTVNALGSFEEPTARVFPFVQAICFPRLVVALAELPPRWPASEDDYDPRIHVVTFGSTKDRDLGPVFERVQEHEHFVLWRCRSGPAGSQESM